ncbi:MAG TPA: DinB family protein [Salinimicrobium sp.]|nr:DinB family protein [Salinimicrobium sp.]
MSDVKERFQQTTDEFIEILKSFSNNELNTVPFDGSWTAGQVGDHLYKSYKSVEILRGTTQTVNRAKNEKVTMFESTFSDLKIKMESPESIKPTADTIKKSELISDLKKRIHEFEDILENEDLSLLCVDFAMPKYGEFTRYEWLAFHTVHTERHIQQLKKIRNHLRTE